MKALKDANGLSEVDILKLQDLLLDWGELFDKATHEEKRQMLRSIIDHATVSGETIEVAIHFDVVKFFEAVSCARETVASLENATKDQVSSYLQNVDSGSSHSHIIAGMITDSLIRKIARTFQKPIKKQIQIKVS